LKKFITQPNDTLFKSSSTKKWGDLVPDVATNSTNSASTKRTKKQVKANKDYLGYCDDPNNKELLARMSDEENEYVYEFFPLMTRPLQAPLVSSGKFFFYFKFCFKFLKSKFKTRVFISIFV